MANFKFNRGDQVMALIDNNPCGLVIDRAVRKLTKPHYNIYLVSYKPEARTTITTWYSEEELL